MPIDLPPFDVPPGYVREESGLIKKQNRLIRPKTSIMPGIGGMMLGASAGGGPMTLDIVDFRAVNYPGHSGLDDASVSLSGMDYQAGDVGLLINVTMKSSMSYPTAVTPSGWTNLYNGTFGFSWTIISTYYSYYRVMVHAKVLNSSESPQSLMDASTYNQWALAIIRPSRPATGWANNISDAAWALGWNESQTSINTSAVSGAAIFYWFNVSYDLNWAINAQSPTTTAYSDPGLTDGWWPRFHARVYGEADAKPSSFTTDYVGFNSDPALSATRRHWQMSACLEIV